MVSAFQLIGQFCTYSVTNQSKTLFSQSGTKLNPFFHALSSSCVFAALVTSDKDSRAFCRPLYNAETFSRSFHRWLGVLPLCQRFRKFRSKFKWKGPFRFLLTGIFGISPGGCTNNISVGILRPNFAVFHIWQTSSLPRLGNSVK